MSNGWNSNGGATSFISLKGQSATSSGQPGNCPRNFQKQDSCWVQQRIAIIVTPGKYQLVAALLKGQSGWLLIINVEMLTKLVTNRTKISK